MSRIAGVNLSASTAASLNRLGTQLSQASEAIAHGSVADDPVGFAAAVTQVKALQVQMKAATMVIKSVDELAATLLSKPRR